MCTNNACFLSEKISSPYTFSTVLYNGSMHNLSRIRFRPIAYMRSHVTNKATRDEVWLVHNQETRFNHVQELRQIPELRLDLKLLECQILLNDCFEPTYLEIKSRVSISAICSVMLLFFTPSIRPEEPC